MTDTWEYMATEGNALPPPDVLNQFGADGWELVQLVQRETDWLAYFKRRRSIVLPPRPGG